MGVLTWPFMWLLVATATTSPVLLPGTYEVQHDQANVVPQQWNDDCGALTPPPVAKRGERVLIDVDTAKKTFRIEGAGRSFGSKKCEGANPSLAVLSAFSDGGKHIIRCRSQRVVRGTEETEHSVEVLDDGRVKIIALFDRSNRVRRNKCRMTLERHTILAPTNPRAVDDEAPDSPRDLPTDSLSIEKALEKELAAAKQENELSTLSVTHAHHMSNDFKLLEARYVLDGRELKDRGRSWPMMKSGESRVVFQDVATPGVHVLEVEFVYLTTVNGAPARVRVKDAAFFDIVEKQGSRLVILGKQVGTTLTPVEKRASLDFSLNGKPVKR
jgi:hypothetical protein